MRQVLYKLFLGLATPAMLIVAIFTPGLTSAESFSYDLGVTLNEITFSKQKFIVGQSVRIYGVVHNYGQNDITGHVAFYLSDRLIGEPQLISSRASGFPEEVFVNWIIPDHPFNVAFKIMDTSPEDQNPVNNQTLTAIVTPLRDTDGDGVSDDSDNCPNLANADQRDSKGNGIGDACRPAPPPPQAAVTSPAPTSPKVNNSLPLASSSSISKTLKQSNSSPVKDTKPVAPKPKVQEKPAEPVNLIVDSSVEWQPVLDYTQLDWNLYKFSGIVNLPVSDDFKYSWQFGDNQTSREREVIHQYGNYGKFQVTLTVSSPDGREKSLTQIIEISFLNWGNARFKLLLVILVLLSVSFFSLGALAKEKSHKYKKSHSKSAKKNEKDEDDFEIHQDPEEKLQSYIDSIVNKKDSKAVSDFNKTFDELEDEFKR